MDQKYDRYVGILAGDIPMPHKEKKKKAAEAPASAAPPRGYYDRAGVTHEDAEKFFEHPEMATEFR